MKKKLLFIALVAGCLALCSFKMYDWVTYKSEDTKFQAEFPVTPTVKKEVQENGTSYNISVETEETIFSVYASVFQTDRDSSPESLNNIFNSFKDVLKATAESKTTFELDGQQGLEAKVKGEDIYINYRLLVVDNIVYQITATGSKDYLPADDVTKFFDSFKLLK